MRLWLWRLVLLAAVGGVVFWGWRVLHPTPQRVIRRELAELANTACIPSNEGQLAKLARAQKLASFFTSDTQITIDLPGRFDQTISGRDEVQQRALAARALLAGLKVEFLDVSVAVDPNGEAAEAHLTGKANIPGDAMPQVEELKLGFKKVEGDWLIQRVENVQTLH